MEDEEVVPQGIDIDGPASSADGDGPPASACGSSNGGLITYMHFVVVVVVVVVPVENCCKIQRRAYARLDLLEAHSPSMIPSARPPL